MKTPDTKAEPSNLMADSFHGYYRTGRGWVRACSGYGPIEYTTEAAACAGALVCAQSESVLQ